MTSGTTPTRRELAAFPAPWTRSSKFWPSVGRVDNVYGDRHLICSCVGMEAYAAGRILSPKTMKIIRHQTSSGPAYAALAPDGSAREIAGDILGSYRVTTRS